MAIKSELVDKVEDLHRDWKANDAHDSILSENGRKEMDFLNQVCYNTILSENIAAKRDAVRGAKEIVQSLASIMNQMQSMADDITAIHSEAFQRMKLIESMSGLAMLPQDILLDIFRFVVFSTSDGRMFDTLRLSHVCRHFHELVLDTPCLWSSIELLTRFPSPEFVALCLERSKESELDIAFQCVCAELFLYDEYRGARHRILNLVRYFRDKEEKYLSLLSRHSRRWRSLRGRISPKSKPEETSAFAVLRDIDASNLQVLELEVGGLHDGFGRSMCPMVRTANSAFSSWRAPNIRLLSSISTVWIPTRSLSNLQSLSITLPEPGGWDVASFFAALSTLHYLSSFKLTFSSYFLNPFQAPLPASFPAISMPNIREFEVELTLVHHDSPATERIDKVLAWVRCPNVQRVFIRYDRCKVGMASASFDTIMSRMVDYKFLTSVKAIFFSHNDQKYERFRVNLNYLGVIKQFEIQTSFTTLNLTFALRGADRYSTLETIQIRGPRPWGSSFRRTFIKIAGEQFENEVISLEQRALEDIVLRREELQKWRDASAEEIVVGLFREKSDDSTRYTLENVRVVNLFPY
ncbi:hypothetical protein SCHPADRAFT_998962 [Schizopora paradoxa]|uniref:F-box domain-containing protein n=1 Tax=Schizopora paradoxa TaxID=27342 RepID=A0A0H2RPD9_9AGAM|nr:hypothetical protein SCHPADRAFT_998962 [Schizopora paradoxa]